MPRAEIEAGLPREVTFAPRVAPVVVILVAVREVTVGTARADETVTFVHDEQLLLLSDSVIVPDMDILLSAQRRTE